MRQTLCYSATSYSPNFGTHFLAHTWNRTNASQAKGRCWTTTVPWRFYNKPKHNLGSFTSRARKGTVGNGTYAITRLPLAGTGMFTIFWLGLKWLFFPYRHLFFPQFEPCSQEILTFSNLREPWSSSVSFTGMLGSVNFNFPNFFGLFFFFSFSSSRLAALAANSISLLSANFLAVFNLIVNTEYLMPIQNYII